MYFIKTPRRVFCWSFPVTIRCEVCQFTGLVDINGKEIYEGDIVNAWDTPAEDPTWSFDKVHLGVIEFYKGAFNLVSNTYKRTPKGEKVYCNFWMYAEKIEVIGNIFENSETIYE